MKISHDIIKSGSQVITDGNNTNAIIVNISATKNRVTPLKTSVTGISFLTPATTKQFKGTWCSGNFRVRLRAS